MDEKSVNALISAIARQRDQALNALAQAEAKIFMLEEEAKNKQKPEGPLADKIVK